MKDNYKRGKSLVLSFSLILTMMFICACDMFSGAEEHKPLGSSTGTVSEEQLDSFCCTDLENLKKNQKNFTCDLEKGKYVFVSSINTEDDLAEVSKVLNMEPMAYKLADLQCILGVLLMQKDGKQWGVPVIGQILLSEVKELEHEGRKEIEGQSDFIISAEGVAEKQNIRLGRKRLEKYETTSADFEEILYTVKSMPEDMILNNAGIFLYYIVGENGLNLNGSAMVCARCSRIKSTEEASYFELKSWCRIYAPKNQVQKFNLKHGVETTNHLQILDSELVGTDSVSIKGFSTGMIYTDLWRFSDIEKTPASVSGTSVIKIKKDMQINTAEVYAGVNYVEILCGERGYKTVTDSFLTLELAV